MGLVGFIFEIVVLGCLVCGIACNATVVGTCEMLTLGLNMGSVGPWRADVNGSGCIGWDKGQTDEDDWILNMARACSMMALCFGCILTFFGFFDQCLCPLPCGRKLIDISGVMVQISLALTWPMIRSQICDRYGCSWGGGATALLLAQLFFLAASIFSRCQRDPRYKRRQERKEEKAEEEAEEEDRATNEEEPEVAKGDDNA